MTTLCVENDNILANPVELVEQVIIDRDWAHDRPNDEEIVAEVPGGWCNYRIWFSWQPEHGALTFSCYFENKLPVSNRSRIYPLLAMINDKLWLGHFGLSEEDGSIAFNHTMLMRGGCVVASQQLEDLMDIAVAECERFFPAFQSVIWSNMAAAKALEMSLFETVGEA